MIRALTKLGGVQYLVQVGTNQPAVFAKLLCMVIPKEVSHSGVITGVQVQIHTNLAMGNQPKVLKSAINEDEEVYGSAYIQSQS